MAISLCRCNIRSYRLLIKVTCRLHKFYRPLFSTRKAIPQRILLNSSRPSFPGTRRGLCNGEMDSIQEPESPLPEEYDLSSEIDEILLSVKDPDSQQSRVAAESHSESFDSTDSVVLPVKRIMPGDFQTDYPQIGAVSKKLHLSPDGVPSVKSLTASYRIWQKQLSLTLSFIEEVTNSQIVSETVEAIKQSSRQVRIGLIALEKLEHDAQLLYEGPNEAPGRGSTNSDLEFSWSSKKVEHEKANAFLRKSQVYWSYKFFRNGAGQAPTVVVCITKADADRELAAFLNEDVVGFDMEWISNRPTDGVKKNISLIQVAIESRIVLIQIARFPGKTAVDLLPPNLVRLLEDKRIAKTGVNIAGDCTRLETYFGIISSGAFELTNLYRLVSYFNDPIKSFSAIRSRKVIKFGTQVETHFGMPLFKGDVRTSRWDRPLSEEQIEYAASDAYAGLKLYRLMDAKRRSFRPTPPLPMFGEAQTTGKTILIGNNETVDQFLIDHKLGPHNKPPPGDEDNPTNLSNPTQQISNDSVLPDPSDIAASHGNTVNAQTAQPSVTSATPNNASPPTVTPSKATAESSPRRSQSPPHPLLLEAQLWAEDHLAKLDPECLEEPMRVRPGYLKAYHLWHVRQLDVEAITHLWAVKEATIAGYIERAVLWGKLPCDKERFESVKEMILPKYRSSKRRSRSSGHD